jgi:uncharacterized protein YutE (UPF0331/DUF86 family)
MTPTKIMQRVVLDRLAWVQQMTSEIEALPLNDVDLFFSDTRNIWTAESCLRRGLEALFDVGRHILAKGFGSGVTEYKEIANQLDVHQILSTEEANLLRLMAGYRNRMVHFYHEITGEELFEICNQHLADLAQLKTAYEQWLRNHPEKVDTSL